MARVYLKSSYIATLGLMCYIRTGFLYVSRKRHKSCGLCFAINALVWARFELVTCKRCSAVAAAVAAVLSSAACAWFSAFNSLL